MGEPCNILIQGKAEICIQTFDQKTLSTGGWSLEKQDMNMLI
jgi:hypothetical protein